MADQNSNEPNLENDKPEDSVGSMKTGTQQSKSSRSSSGSKRGLSLPPELVSKRHPVSEYRQKVITITRPKYLLVVVLLILSLGIGFLGGWLGSSSHQNSVNNQSIFDSKQTVVSSQSQVIAAVAKEVNPSVVSITATQTTAPTTSLFGFSTGAGSSEDAGTGIILSASGLIITNHHVIPDGTTSVSVTLSDGTTYNNVQVVGTTSDSSSLDIGFLKIDNLDGRKLVPAVIGDSSQMTVGSSVVAIGNALGQFQNTVTSGIISGYGRSVQATDSTGSTEEDLTDLFQTDAAINEGNSGGPLVNLSGQVVGINTAIASNSQNIGFAIPINDITGLIQGVEKTGKLEQPYLGVLYIPITSDIASQYNLSVSQGAWIPPTDVTGQASVIAGGPAANAGLQTGDVITAIDGQQLNQNTSLTSIIDKDQVGQVVTLSVQRGNKSFSIKVTLGNSPTTTSTTQGD
jgi:S1-C subfamily serine protease